MTTWTDDLVDSALCLWEALIDLHCSEQDNPISHAFDANGYSAMRNRAMGWAEQCHNDWVAVHPHDFDDPFDWEWCPKWLLERIDWSDPAHPQVKRS
jgi:hypothetical protein